MMQKPNTIEMFWNFISKTDECWIWIGKTLQPKGKPPYGHFSYQGRPWAAHRFMWYLIHGENPGRLFVCHKCDNRLCVNPDHLFLGTALDNARDAMQKGRNSRGEKHGASKLKSEDVLNIRRDYDLGLKTQLALSKEYGVAKATIQNVVTRVTWRHLSWD